MPRVTEYSCRLKDPKRFQQKTFRRISSGDVDLVIARPYGKTKTRAQAIRYPRELWDEKAARQSCRKRKGKFEPVRGKRAERGMRNVECGMRNEKPLESNGLLIPKSEIRIPNSSIRIPKSQFQNGLNI